MEPAHRHTPSAVHTSLVALKDTAAHNRGSTVSGKSRQIKKSMHRSRTRPRRHSRTDTNHPGTQPVGNTPPRQSAEAWPAQSSTHPGRERQMQMDQQEHRRDPISHLLDQHLGHDHAQAPSGLTMAHDQGPQATFSASTRDGSHTGTTARAHSGHRHHDHVSPPLHRACQHSPGTLPPRSANQQRSCEPKRTT